MKLARAASGLRDAAVASLAAARGPQPAGDLWWLCWMFAWRVALRPAKYAVRLPLLVRLVRLTAGGTVTDQRGAWRRLMLSRWHRSGSALLPANCLERSLLVHGTWARVSSSTHLVVGFRRAGEQTHGHTWVTEAGEVLLESPAAIEGFQPACIFDADGTSLPAQA